MKNIQHHALRRTFLPSVVGYTLCLVSQSAMWAQPASSSYSAQDMVSAAHSANGKFFLRADQDSFQHATYFGSRPQIVQGLGLPTGTQVAQFTLSTYNPNHPNYALGTEIWTNKRWSLQQGYKLTYESRIRFSSFNKRGFIPAFFAYTDKGVDNEPYPDGTDYWSGL